MPEMRILRTGNGFIFMPSVSQYFFVQDQVIQVHKSTVKDSLGPHFAKDAYFLMCLPPDLCLKIAF